MTITAINQAASPPPLLQPDPPKASPAQQAWDARGAAGVDIWHLTPEQKADILGKVSDPAARALLEQQLDNQIRSNQLLPIGQNTPVFSDDDRRLVRQVIVDNIPPEIANDPHPVPEPKAGENQQLLHDYLVAHGVGDREATQFIANHICRLVDERGAGFYDGPIESEPLNAAADKLLGEVLTALKSRQPQFAPIDSPAAPKPLEPLRIVSPTTDKSVTLENDAYRVSTSINDEGKTQVSILNRLTGEKTDVDGELGFDGSLTFNLGDEFKTKLRIDTASGTQQPSTVTITDNQGNGNQITGLESGSITLQAQHDPAALTAKFGPPSVEVFEATGTQQAASNESFWVDGEQHGVDLTHLPATPPPVESTPTPVVTPPPVETPQGGDTPLPPQVQAMKDGLDRLYGAFVHDGSSIEVTLPFKIDGEWQMFTFPVGAPKEPEPPATP